MAAVNVVRGLASLVGSVQQSAIFGVPHEQLGQLAAPPPDGDVKGRVPLLRHQAKAKWPMTAGSRE